MAQSSSSSAQTLPQISFVKEVGNAYVQMICNNGENRISCFVDDQGVDETPREFLNGDLKNGHPLDMAYRVRIPALMFIKSTPNAVDEDVTNFMLDKSRCRRQFGTFLYVQSTAVAKPERSDLMYKATYWGMIPESDSGKPKSPRQYFAYSGNPISSVYPCCKHDNKGNLKMILGLCFSGPLEQSEIEDTQDDGDWETPKSKTSKRKESKSQSSKGQPWRSQSSSGQLPRSLNQTYKRGLKSRRMFGRQHVTNKDNPNGIYPLPNQYSFDIEEDFIDINRNANEMNFKNSKIFENTTNWVALYVCRGARLVVRDTWYGTNEKGDVQDIPQGQPGHHCRSLFQQGSLVTVSSGYNSILLNVIKEKTEMVRKDRDVHGVPYDWMINHFVTNTTDEDPKLFVDPPVKDLDATERQIADDELPPNMNFTKNRHKVFFLGAIESQYNSVCWYIDIGRSKGNYTHKIDIYWPEGGVLQDYSTWRTGFHQIYHRHRYERLFESVLISEGVPLPTNLPFQVPPNDDQGNYFFRRILGYRENGNYANNVMKLHSSIYTDLDIPQDFNDDCQYDRDVRRYIASDETIPVRRRRIQFILDKPSLPEFLKWPALIPPLYPPVKATADLVFLDKTDKVVSVKKTGPDAKYGTYFQILSRPNEYYKLDKTNAKLTPWMTGLFDQKHEHHVTSKHTGDLKKWTRFGDDYLTQYKWYGCPVYKDGRYQVLHGENKHKYTPKSDIGTWYFVKVENPGSDFTETVDWTKLHHK